MSGPCAKQTVTATLVCASGQRFVATNAVDNPQASCPRAGMPTGVGYDLCRAVCRQRAHAEVAVLGLAGALRAAGGTLFLEGHTYACEPCQRAAVAAGVVIVVGPPPPIGGQP